MVEPKIEKLREAEAELRVATKERQQVEEELAVVQAKLDEMQRNFDAAMAQKQVRCSRSGTGGARGARGQLFETTEGAKCLACTALPTSGNRLVIFGCCND